MGKKTQEINEKSQMPEAMGAFIPTHPTPHSYPQYHLKAGPFKECHGLCSRNWKGELRVSLTRGSPFQFREHGP